MKTVEQMGKRSLSSLRWTTCTIKALRALLAIFLFVSLPMHADCKVKNETQGTKYHSLQLAINEASPGDTIKVIGKCGGNFTIDTDLILEGADGATLDGQKAGNVLLIGSSNPSITVTIKNLIIQNGNALAPFPDGGGINSRAATLHLEQVKVKNNIANNGGGLFLVEGMISLTKCYVGHNSSFFDGAGMFISESATQLTKCHIGHNIATCGSGGGINVSSSELSLTDCEVVNNSANTGIETFVSTSGCGGGISAFASTSILNRVTIRENFAAFVGGGINQVGVDCNMTFNDSRLVKNGAATLGGGFYQNDSATTTFNHSKVKENLATREGGGIYNDVSAALMVLNDTEVEDNLPNDITDF